MRVRGVRVRVRGRAGANLVQLLELVGEHALVQLLGALPPHARHHLVLGVVIGGVQRSERLGLLGIQRVRLP